MIHEVDEALRLLLRRDAFPGSEIEVVFEAPTKDWASRRNSPTVDLYLYDIREDLRRRQVGEIVERSGDGIVTTRQSPPRWFKLSYLITAWTQRPEDEHRLLSATLGCFLRQDAIPRDLLPGSLAELRAALSYTIALPTPEDRALSDVWSALGGELKPTLDLVLTAPFDLSRSLPVGPPVEEPLGIDLRDSLGDPGDNDADIGSARDEPRRRNRRDPEAEPEPQPEPDAKPAPRRTKARKRA